MFKIFLKWSGLIIWPSYEKRLQGLDFPYYDNLKNKTS